MLKTGKKKKMKKEEESTQNKFAANKNNGVSFTSAGITRKDQHMRMRSADPR